MEALDRIARAVPPELPLAVETLNKNYLAREYFQFFKERGIIPGLSDKLYRQRIHEAYELYGNHVALSINNHYEGSALKAAAFFTSELADFLQGSPTRG